MQTMKELIITESYHGTARLDPRCRLLLLILLGLLSYFVNGDLIGLLLMLGVCLFISAGNGGLWVVKMLFLYLIVSYLNSCLRFLSVPGLSLIMSVFGVTLLKLLPIYTMGRWILRTTHMDDLMVALQKLKLPHAITIPLVVMFRYIPTLGIEYRMIKHTMSIRGICDTALKRVLHPLLTIECILIPLLMRCLKVTDELAASGTTRGLERTARRHALHPVAFTAKEYLVTFTVILFFLGLLYLDHTSLGTVVLWRVSI